VGEPEYRHRRDGRLDEIGVEGPAAVHIERMAQNEWWVGITLADGRLVHVRLWALRERIYANYVEESPDGTRLLAGGDYIGGPYVPEHPRVRRAGV
jgi:hypothetical protein